MKYATLFLCFLVAATILNPSAPAAVAVVALALLIAFDRYADALAQRGDVSAILAAVQAQGARTGALEESVKSFGDRLTTLSFSKAR